MLHKLTAPLFLLLLPAILQAQITLNRSNLPTAGTNIVTQEIDSVWLAGIDFSTTGGGQQWDFSDVLNTNDLPDTTYFIDPAGTAFEANFPDANLAATPDPGNPGAGLEYQRLSAEAFEILGFQDTVIFNKNFGPEQRLTFPFDETSSIDQSFDFFVDLVEFQDTGTVEQQVQVDAWGQIILPIGSFDCLRVKRERLETFSVFGLPVQIENTIYEFWTADFIAPVLVYDSQFSTLFGGDDETLTGSHLIAQNILTSRRQPPSPVRNVELFPNPASKKINLEFTLQHQEAIRILVFNPLGQLVHQQPSNQFQAGDHRLALDLAGLPATIYKIVLYGDRGWSESRMVALQSP